MHARQVGDHKPIAALIDSKTHKRSICINEDGSHDG